MAMGKGRDKNTHTDRIEGETADQWAHQTGSRKCGGVDHQISGRPGPKTTWRSIRTASVIRHSRREGAIGAPYSAVRGARHHRRGSAPYALLVLRRALKDETDRSVSEIRLDINYRSGLSCRSLPGNQDPNIPAEAGKANVRRAR